MIISRSGWNRFIDTMNAINTTAGKKFAAYLRQNPVTDTETRKAALDYAANLVSVYGESSAAVACEMYDSIAQASGKTVASAAPAEIADYGEVAKTISGIMKTSEDPDHISSGISRLVKQAGADTTIKNAIRDRVEWAWVPSGDTCAFCITLASRGWQRASKKVLKDGHAEHIHANCDCEFAIRFDNSSNVEGYDPEKYRAIYDNAEGNTPQEKINGIRRKQYAENAEKIQLQKEEAQKREKERLAKPVVTDTPQKVEKPVYGCRDVTNDWLKKAMPNSHPVTDIETFVQDGVTYTVDGENIKFIYTDEEKAIAELLRRELGGEVRMMPKVEKPERVETPDYIFRSRRFDLKQPEKTNKNTIYNSVHNKRRQADNFVIDISKNGMSVEEAEKQVEKLYKNPYVTFVDTIIITKNNQICRIFTRNK